MKTIKAARTSAEVATMAGRTLRDPKSTPTEKSIAGSALRQRRVD